MSKKSLLVLAMTLSMVAILAIGGTLAYFTDTDYNKNVMVTGNVEIDQLEKQRGDNGLEDFEDDQKMLPAVGDNNNDGKLDVAYDDGPGRLFSADRNVIDKMISVKNTGSEEAYVRTIIAFEIPAMVDGYEGETLKDVEGAEYIDVVNVDPYLYTVMNEGATAGKGYTLPKDGDAYVIIEKDNVNYLVTEYYYKNESKLAGKIKNEDGTYTYAETAPSLKQIYMSAQATNESTALMFGEDGEYTILALSQAVQTEGFDDAKTALDKAFGVTNTENAQEWFDTYVDSHGESAETPAA